MHNAFKKAGTLTAIAAGAFLATGCDLFSPKSDAPVPMSMDFESAANVTTITVTHSACTSDKHLIEMQNQFAFPLNDKTTDGALPENVAAKLERVYNKYVTPAADEMNKLMFENIDSETVKITMLNMTDGASPEDIDRAYGVMMNNSLRLMNYGLENMESIMADSMQYTSEVEQILTPYVATGYYLSPSVPSQQNAQPVALSAAPSPKCM